METVNFGDKYAWFDFDVNSACHLSTNPRYYTYSLDNDYTSDGISIDVNTGTISIIKDSTKAKTVTSVIVQLDYYGTYYDASPVISEAISITVDPCSSSDMSAPSISVSFI